MSAWQTTPKDVADEARCPVRWLALTVLVLSVLLVGLSCLDLITDLRTRTALPKMARLTQLEGTLGRLDDTLRFSARLAAASGEPQWPQQWRGAGSALAVAFADVLRLVSADQGRDAALRAQEASAQLRAVEGQAMLLVGQGRLAEARSLLSSTAYERQEVRLVQELRRFARGRAVMAQQIEHWDDWHAWWEIGDTLLVLPVLLGGWLLVRWIMRRWQAALLEHNRQLSQHARQLAELNASLDEKVAERTAILARETAEHQHALEALRQSDVKFRQLAENIRDVFWISTPDLQEILYLSPAYEEIWGRPAETLRRNPLEWADAIVPEDRARVLQANARLAAEGTSSSLEYLIRRPDGSVRWIHDRGFPVRDAQGKVIRLAGVAADVTERKQAEEALAHRARLALLGRDVAAAITQGDSIRHILQRCAQAVVTHLDAAFARIWTLNEAEQVLELQASAGQYTHLDGPHGRVPVGALKIGRIAAERRPHLTNAVIGDPDVGDQDWARREGMVAFGGYPLIVADRLVGVMAMFARRALPEDTLETLAMVADTIALCIERKRVEEGLRENEARFRLTFEQAAIGVAHVAPDGRWLRVNERLCAILGYSGPELRERTFQDITHPDDLAANVECQRKMLAGEIHTARMEKRYVRKDGSPVWANVSLALVRHPSGEPNHFITVVEDVSERKQADERLRERDEQIRLLLDSTAEGIYGIDRDGHCTLCNAAAARLLGYERPDQLLSQNMHALAHHHRADGTPYPFEECRAGLAVQRAEPTHVDDEVFWRADGTSFPTEYWAHPIHRDGQVVGAVVTFVDITERQRAQAELKSIHRQLLDASRRAGMAEVATSVLHNVGNVLNSVNVSTALVAGAVRKSKVSDVARLATLLQEHAQDLTAFFTQDPRGVQVPGYLLRLSQALAEEQQMILSECRALGQYVEHIKEIVALQQNYAKITGVAEKVAVTDLVEDALRMNSAAFLRHDVEVAREYAEVPPIIVERHKVLQILVNLVSNAKYALTDSGQKTKQLTLRVESGGSDGVRVSVIDNGIGIPPENLTRVFEHGFTTRKNGHGFGLHSGALAARELGGTLRAHSDGPGRGATFTLELPFRPPKARALGANGSADFPAGSPSAHRRVPRWEHRAASEIRDAAQRADSSTQGAQASSPALDRSVPAVGASPVGPEVSPSQVREDARGPAVCAALGSQGGSRPPPSFECADMLLRETQPHPSPQDLDQGDRALPGEGSRPGNAAILALKEQP